jgi:hypothetical protein
MRIHPLDKLALQIHQAGRHQAVRAKMKRSTQSRSPWILLLLLASMGISFAPHPFEVSPRAIVYVAAGDPSGLSLANSDPDTFRIKSRIDFSLKPDIIP